jgi:peptidoglycan/xylan/chitin deacetylase (PgdA/CDA1 family)
MRLLVLAALVLAVGEGAARATAPMLDVPILEYHVIGDHASGSPLEGLYVAPEEFAQQVDWLAANGWRTVTLGQVAAAWRGGRALPPRSVVISFDDGYPGVWRYAMPILRRHGFVGVLNLQIGNLVPRHVRQLIAAGWEIDSHTFTHPDLRTVTDEQLDREVVHSRRWLQSVFHVPVPAFCYPFGRYDARVVAAVERAGYLLAETENQGWASPGEGLLTLDRLRVTPETGVEGVASLLRG